MSLHSRFFVASCTALSLAASSGCATIPAAPDPMTVTATLESIDASPGCGIILFGSPLTFQVTSGPRGIRHERITAMVPCIEFYENFYLVGHSYQLRLTRDNIRKIELPDRLANGLSFYLIDATNIETGEKTTWGRNPP